jgi:HNH endonuclease
MLSRLVTSDDGCLIWTGATVNGYGVVRGEGGRSAKSLYVHRVMYEMFGSSIPDGMQIDHLCRNKRCANLAHLEVVTLKENVLRADGKPALLARQPEQCEHGHAYTPENTIYRMVRSCRTCRQAYGRRRYRRNKEGDAKWSP